jgi:multicomponent Na+:H+ antiporter subunit E
MALNWRFRKYFFYQDEMFRTSAMTTKLNVGRFILYLPWLTWQIVTASLQVAYVVMSPRMPIDPALVKFKTKLSNISSKVILGNSITLTPGTITLNITGDEFLVHSLMDVSFSGIENDALPLKVARLFDRKPGQVIYDLQIIRNRKAE